MRVTRSTARLFFTFFFSRLFSCSFFVPIHVLLFLSALLPLHLTAGSPLNCSSKLPCGHGRPLKKPHSNVAHWNPQVAALWLATRASRVQPTSITRAGAILGRSGRGNIKFNPDNTCCLYKNRSKMDPRPLSAGRGRLESHADVRAADENRRDAGFLRCRPKVPTLLGAPVTRPDGRSA